MPVRVAITGATGLIGGALAEALRERGDEVLSVSRSAGGEDTLRWDPRGGGLEDPRGFSGVDAVVNLAGESIAGRWTEAKKERIRQSRVAGTRAVVAAIAEADPRPRVLVNASAVGFYGARKDEILHEDSGPGTNFLAEVTRDWEQAAAELEAIEDPPVRLCLARFGVVLAEQGGALEQMLTPFRLGVGGRIGDGRQWMPWVHLADVVAALLHMLDDGEASGPYNVVAPAPVRNREFTRSLGRALRRPTVLPLPKLGVKLALGEMGEALLLDSQRATPARLLDEGFQFRFETLDSALEDLVG